MVKGGTVIELGNDKSRDGEAMKVRNEFLVAFLNRRRF
jgi:hypothetical protein